MLTMADPTTPNVTDHTEHLTTTITPTSAGETTEPEEVDLVFRFSVIFGVLVFWLLIFAICKCCSSGDEETTAPPYLRHTSSTKQLVDNKVDYFYGDRPQGLPRDYHPPVQRVATDHSRLHTEHTHHVATSHQSSHVHHQEVATGCIRTQNVSGHHLTVQHEHREHRPITPPNNDHTNPAFVHTEEYYPVLPTASQTGHDTSIVYKTKHEQRWV